MKKVKIIFSILKILWKLSPMAILVSMLSYIGFALCTVFSTKVLAELIQSIFQIDNGDNYKKIYTLIGLYLGIFIFRKIINVLSDLYINIGIEEKCRYYLKIELHSKISKLPYIDFENAKILDQLKRSRDCIEYAVLTDIYLNLLSIIECTVTVIGLLMVMLQYSFWYVPILLCTMIPYFICRIFMGKEFYRLHWFQAPHLRKRDYLFQLFSKREVQKEQRAYLFGKYLKNKWDVERGLVEKETWDFRNKDSRRLCMCEMLVTVGYIASILLSLYLLFSQSIEIGIFGASIFAFQEVQNATKYLFTLVATSFSQLLEAGEYFEFMAFPEEAMGEIKMKQLEEGISLNNVAFTYPNGNVKALDIKSLNIKAGEKIVIVGENGSGKTTLSKIVLGLYAPNEGNVYYDAINLKEIDRNDLYKNVATVSQNCIHYYLSIRQNFGITNEGRMNDDSKISSMLSSIGLEKLIDKSHHSFDQSLGREFDGLDLSGGEWQKLAIAKALFKEDGQIIVLDEPTSALDPSTETEILNQFLTMTRNKTAIIISHRVGLCKYADKVIYMERGKIIESGKHEELMAIDKAYCKFYNEQAKWYR